MKKMKNLILGIGVLLCSNLIGQTAVEGFGTYINGEDITIVSRTAPQIAEDNDGTHVEITDILCQLSGNQIPTTDHVVHGGPIFYNSGPGGSTMTCWSGGICAEMANTTYTYWCD